MHTKIRIEEDSTIRPENTGINMIHNGTIQCCVYKNISLPNNT